MSGVVARVTVRVVTPHVNPAICSILQSKRIRFLWRWISSAGELRPSTSPVAGEVEERVLVLPCVTRPPSSSDTLWTFIWVHPDLLWCCLNPSCLSWHICRRFLEFVFLSVWGFLSGVTDGRQDRELSMLAFCKCHAILLQAAANSGWQNAIVLNSVWCASLWRAQIKPKPANGRLLFASEWHLYNACQIRFILIHTL